MKRIGIIASNSSESSATVILQEGLEREVKVEDLVLIKNRATGEDVLAVLRSGEGVNEALKTTIYRPGIAYAKKGGMPSGSRETFNFKAVAIGTVAERGVEQNRSVIAPRSEVFLFNSKDENPFEKLAIGREALWGNLEYEMNRNWKVPVDKFFIPYHIGVFGSTGAGKSFLTRFALIPLLRKAGYDVLIFDWKGDDYTPFFTEDQRMDFKDIYLDDDTVVSYLSRKMDDFGVRSAYQSNPIRDALEDVIYDGGWREKELKNLRSFLLTSVRKLIEDENKDRYGKLTAKGLKFMRKAEKYFSKLSDFDLELILGKNRPEDVTKKVRGKRILVIDMSKGSKDEKLSVFLSIASCLKELMEKGEELKIALIIDEAPQYAPFRPTGLEQETTKMIKDLCALGRSKKLAIALISQGIAGEIGINASVRRNLNTLFFGRLHPLDIYEAEKWLKAYAINTEFLLTMKPGKFYFVGAMNPSPIPLLITFKVGEVDE